MAEGRPRPFLLLTKLSHFYIIITHINIIEKERNNGNVARERKKGTA